MKTKKKKECMICGNDKPRELEAQTLYSDGDGNDGVYKEYVCKEGKGCS